MLRCQDKIHFGRFCVLLVLFWLIKPLESQGDMDGQDIVEDESSKDMMEHDPNIVNPINQEGYGENIPTTVGDTSGKYLRILRMN